MTTRPLEEEYFEWLCSQILTDGNSYTTLMQLLFAKEFEAHLSSDENRLEDGLELRVEFLHQSGDPISQDELTERDCSVLEVLIGLSRRISFITGEDEDAWAWQLIKNLELHKMKDPVRRRQVTQIDEILEGLIYRTYHGNGLGGFFPLAWPEHDQTQVELWYQMNEYLAEQFQP